MDATTRSKTVKDIIFSESCRVFGVKYYDIVSPTRFHERCCARNVIMYFLRFKLAMTYQRIAGTVGRANHTTAIYGIRQAKKWRADDPGFRAKFEDVREAINARLNNAGL